MKAMETIKMKVGGGTESKSNRTDIKRKVSTISIAFTFFMIVVGRK